MRSAPLITLFLLLLAPTQALGFCGFFVGSDDAKLFSDATQVVLMRDKKTTVLSMQNKYEGPLANFAMVVPVPQILKKENVKTLEKKLFDRVDVLSAPRLVEYWEQDPCSQWGYGGLGARGFGSGGGGGASIGRLSRGRGYVKVKEKFKVGEYDIAILDTNDATALDAWLKKNNYRIPDGAAPYFRPYIEGGMYFFVAKIDAKKAKYSNGKAVLSPLRFHYKSDEFSLPIRLGMINSKGTQDLLVYILSPSKRYEAANFPNVTIPTNIEVGPRTKGQFGEFYEALFSRTLEENPKAVVTEYAWSAQKCDPCPTGIAGGAALRPSDLASLGNDILGKPAGWNSSWVLTRLHARYAKDGIGEDLVFREAKPLLGGREMRDDDGTLEKGSKEGTTNNFQGRYIIRHEWEGEAKCDKPVRGRWGGPPDPYGMELLSDAVVTEMRRSDAVQQGLDPAKADFDAPWTPQERAAVAFQTRRRFGTSAVPEGVGPESAPSQNTRGVSARTGPPVILGQLIKEPVLELNLSPSAAPEPSKTSDSATNNAPKKNVTPRETKPRETPAPPPAGCTTATNNASPWALLILLGFWRRKRCA